MEDNIKKYITSLLTSTPLTMTMQQLGKDYRNTIGEPIPFHKLGYHSLEHFLRSLTDTVEVRGSGPMAEILPIISSKSAHINNLVTHQKITSKKKTFGPAPLRKHLIPYQMHYPLPNININKKRIHYPTSSDNFPKSFSQSQDVHKIPEDTPKITNNLKISNSRKQETQTYAKSNEKNSALTVNNVNVNNIYESQSTNCPSKKSSPRQCVEKTTSKIDSLERHYPKNTREIIDNIKLQQGNLENNVPPTIRNNLRILISHFPEGIWCADVPASYRKMFRSDLRYQELGFRSLIDLCSCLTSIFHYVRPSTEDFKLYDRSRPLPDCVEKNFTVASYCVKESDPDSSSNALPQIDWEDVLTFLPEGTFKPGNEIPRAFIPHETKPNDTLDIVAGEIYDISKFWVYIDNGLLDKLMDELQVFYSSHENEYQMPEHLIREGIYCVQMIFGEYHRALIVDVMPEVEGMIRVIFIDYGTMTKVSKNGLCFLHNKFAELPAQAIRCKLANVCPTEKGMPWSREASKYFRQLLLKRDLTAKILRINWEDQYLEIYLADVTDANQVFYINDHLVVEGYACYPDQVTESPIKNESKGVVQNKRELLLKKVAEIRAATSSKR